MLRFFVGGKERADALLRDAQALASARETQMQALTNEQLLALTLEPANEKVMLGRFKTVCCWWRESVEDGSTLFLVQVWGDGFIVGGWLLAYAGFVLADGERRQLTAEELRVLNL